MREKGWERYLELQKEKPELFNNDGPIKIVFDRKIVESFCEINNCEIGVIYESDYNLLLVDLVYDNGGHYYAYERIIPKVNENAVVILPVYKEKIVMLRQYRHAIREFQYAVPRGFAEQGLSCENNARKELAEEIGAVVDKVVYLGEVIADSGMRSGKASVYACNIQEYSRSVREEGVSDIIELSSEELNSMIVKGTINDGYTLAALELYNVRNV